MRSLLIEISCVSTKKMWKRKCGKCGNGKCGNLCYYPRVFVTLLSQRRMNICSWICDPSYPAFWILPPSHVFWFNFFIFILPFERKFQADVSSTAFPWGAYFASIVFSFVSSRKCEAFQPFWILGLRSICGSFNWCSYRGYCVSRFMHKE